VPFKGASPAVMAVAGDQVDMTFAPVTAVAGPVKSGRLRALAVPSVERIAAFPDVPTMRELGVVGVEMRDWHGIVAPAGTPQSSIVRIANEVATILARPDVRERLIALGLEPEADSGPDAFGELIQSELARWGKFAREAGIRAD
jgi:tripartite-type tricarboxylate transporter receptor subunit TctC